MTTAMRSVLCSIIYFY